MLYGAYGIPFVFSRDILWYNTTCSDRLYSSTVPDRFNFYVFFIDPLPLLYLALVPVHLFLSVSLCFLKWESKQANTVKFNYSTVQYSTVVAAFDLQLIVFMCDGNLARLLYMFVSMSLRWQCQFITSSRTSSCQPIVQKSMCVAARLEREKCIVILLLVYY